jgi:hypothetical protein
MGVLIDITPRLTLARRLRTLLSESLLRSIFTTTRYIEALESEIERQQLVLCDRYAQMDRVEEAIAGLDLLGELLRERRRYLAQLEADYLAQRVG